MEPSTSAMDQLLAKKKSLSCTEPPLILLLNPKATDIFHQMILIGKIISDRNLNHNKVIAILQKAWCPPTGMSITPMGNNIFLI